MRIYHNTIPSTHIFTEAAGVPKESILSDVTIYEEALEYIKCDIANTIRHEAAHREDEERRDLSVNPDFQAYTAEGRAEPIAEQSEQSCDALYPQNLSKPITVNVNQVFEEAKSMSGIDPGYLPDVKAVVLDESVKGMYYMQEIPGMYGYQGGNTLEQSGGFQQVQGWDGTQYINVGVHFNPWMVKEQPKTFGPNVQTDGMEADPDMMQQMRGGTSIPSSPSVPAVPSIGAR
jgi:hypothetical protein